jgi:NADPH:quinone reductase-like Zn-dependent oxidoreductase
MKAAIVTTAGAKPLIGEFQAPASRTGFEIIHVKAAALTNITRGRASGTHYSASNAYPLVAGVDGTGVLAEGRRVYFIMPEAPFGAMGEQTLVDSRHMVPLPDELDDVAAAALANPGLSCFAAFMERAHLQPGETVLINGATGAAGSVAVQVAKHLGAARVIVTGRNAQQLEALRILGADIALPFDLSEGDQQGVKEFDQRLCAEFMKGVDVVIDYLWGTSARTIIVAIAKAVEDAHPVRFIQVGGASGQPLELPSAALRSSAIQIMGSGLKSVPFEKLMDCIRRTFDLAAKGELHLTTRTVPLSAVTEHWDDDGKPRLVFTMMEK